jgi:hypothetical protein
MAGVRYPARTGILSLRHCVQTGSETHPVFCPIGIGEIFPRGVKLTTHLHLMSRLRMHGAVPPFHCLCGVVLSETQRNYKDPMIIHYAPHVEKITPYTRAVCKVRGLTLLLRVGNLWRCGDVLFFEVSPLSSDAFLTTLHPLLENVLQTVDLFKISCLGTFFSWLEEPRNRMGRDLN